MIKSFIIAVCGAIGFSAAGFAVANSSPSGVCTFVHARLTHQARTVASTVAPPVKQVRTRIVTTYRCGKTKPVVTTYTPWSSDRRSSFELRSGR